jgi:hypothetical protein
MNRLTAEWVQKAEGDFIVAQKMLRARKQPVFEEAKSAFHGATIIRNFFRQKLGMG